MRSKTATASSDDELEIKTPATPESGESEIDIKPAAKKAKTSKAASTSPKGKQVHNKWTPEEDATFADIVSNVLRTDLWKAVQADGRLVHRGRQGIVAHAVALMNKLKKKGE